MGEIAKQRSGRTHPADHIQELKVHAQHEGGAQEGAYLSKIYYHHSLKIKGQGSQTWRHKGPKFKTQQKPLAIFCKHQAIRACLWVSILPFFWHSKIAFFDRLSWTCKPQSCARTLSLIYCETLTPSTCTQNLLKNVVSG